jgi:hypothetical protein
MGMRLSLVTMALVGALWGAGNGAVSLENLDGVKLVLPVGKTLSRAKAFTLEAWVRVDARSDWTNLCSTAGGSPESGLSVSLHGNGIYPCARNGGNYHINFGGAYRLHQWFHMAYVFDGSLPANQAIRLFVDGQPRPFTYVHMGEKKPAGLPEELGDLELGPFGGAVDEIRIWRGALKAAEVAAWWWRELDDTHPRRQELAHRFAFAGALADSAGGTAATLAGAKLTADGPPLGDRDALAGLGIAMRSRYDFYTGGTLGEILIEGAPEGEFQLQVALGERGLGTSPTQAVRGGLMASFPLSSLPEGESHLRCAILRGGRALATREVMIKRLPPKPNQVRVDRLTGGVEVDGLPQIPFGFYCYTNHTGDDHPQPELAAQEVVRGFTMMSPYQSCAPEHRERRKAYLDRCARLGMRVHYNVIVPARHAATNPKQVEANLSQIEDEIRAFRDHPAILGYYISDEPELRRESPEVLERIYRRIRELDPYHPVTIVFISPPPAQRYAKALDIVMCDPYPIPNRGPAYAGDLIGRLNSAFQLRNPVWIVPQAFGGNEHWAREPTRQEERLMTYLGVMQGATGVQYFIRDGMNGFPKSAAAWAECALCAVEVAQLTPDLLSVEPRPAVVAEPATVRVTARQRDGLVTVIAANIQKAPAALIVRLPDAVFTGKATCPFEDRTVDIKEGVIEDLIDTYGTRVYQFRIAPASPSQATPAKENALRNGSFESTPSAGVPAACYVKVGRGQGMSYFIDSRLAVHGRNSLRVHVPDTENVFSMNPFNMKIKKAQAFRLSVWARGKPMPAIGESEAQPAELQLTLAGYDGPDAYTSERRGSTVNAGAVNKVLGVRKRFVLSSEWQRYELYGVARTNRTNVTVAINTPGTVWLDLLELVPIPALP